GLEPALQQRFVLLAERLDNPEHRAWALKASEKGWQGLSPSCSNVSLHWLRGSRLGVVPGP
ncbi:hypothetical protein, partial [Mesorhizobium sp. M1A.F.Ca.IN.020.32.1.1]|uniref:hypothetical protein n=1 Tax=Mesorhizobium sp. M1A.F.Ca.IN.020.32.1.1 TaxID=2496763 RepID=UPI0019D4BEE5